MVAGAIKAGSRFAKIIREAPKGIESLVNKLSPQEDVKRLAEIEFLKDNNVSQSTLDNPFFGYQYKERVKGYEDDISNAYMSPPTPKEIPRNYFLTKAQAEDAWGEKKVDDLFNSWLNEENAKRVESSKGPNKKFNRPYDSNPVFKKTKKPVKNLADETNKVLKQKGFFPNEMKDEVSKTILTNQARGLHYKDPENFLSLLKNKDEGVLDNLSTSVKKYKSGVTDLIEEKKRITDPNSKLGKSLYKIAQKYYPGNSAKSKLIDFAHIFPFGETAKVDRASGFLDIGGSPDAMYLSPSYVNQSIQRSIEASIKNIYTALKAEPTPQLQGEFDRLQKLLKKVKALSILTIKGENPKAFGYQVSGGKFKTPRFNDDEYEELFEYLLSAQPDAKAADLIKSQGVYKYPYSYSKYKHPYLGVLVKDGGLIDTNLDDTSTVVDDLPLLDPQESIERHRMAAGGVFNLYKTLSKVPKAVGSYIKQSKGTPSSASDISVTQAVEDKPAMYLSTVDAIENTPDAAKMNAQQWLGTIKNKPGVSGTELDEFGLEALLTNVGKADSKRQLTKPELLEMYNKEMPQIDMDISMAEPVSRGADDIVQMLTKTRPKTNNSNVESANVFSNDARLFNELQQPPQDVTGMKVREMLLNNMQNLQVSNTAADPINSSIIKFLKKNYQGVEMHKGVEFKEMWETGFPKMFHGTNDIVKKDHFEVLKNLVPQEDIAQLAKSKNIPEEKAFEQLYQALNIFDRNVMTADVPIPFWTKKLLYRMGDMSEGRGFFYKSKKNPTHEGTQFIPGGSGYGELKFYHNFKDGSVRSAESKYNSGHFGGEGFKGEGGNSPFGWLRFSERTDESGRKLLLVEETQSDLHQNVAQKGYRYAPRLDKGNVMTEMSDFAAQLVKKEDTLASTRLRKDNLLQLPREERNLPENVAELKNVEKAMSKLVGDIKSLRVKVQKQNAETGKSGSVHPDVPFKKSENYAKVFMQGLMKMADDQGYDGIGLSTGKMKKQYGGIPKGGDKFYEEIGVKAMKRIAKKSGFKFGDTTIMDGNGFTWEKIPIISMRDINTGKKFAGESTIPVYNRGGQVNKRQGYNGY